jgi:hypothetical protein
MVDEQGLPAYGPKSAHGRIDAAGEDGLGFEKEALRVSRFHAKLLYHKLKVARATVLCRSSPAAWFQRGALFLHQGACRFEPWITAGRADLARRAAESLLSDFLVKEL